MTETARFQTEGAVSFLTSGMRSHMLMKDLMMISLPCCRAAPCTVTHDAVRQQFEIRAGQNVPYGTFM